MTICAMIKILIEEIFTGGGLIIGPYRDDFKIIAGYEAIMQRTNLEISWVEYFNNEFAGRKFFSFYIDNERMEFINHYCRIKDYNSAIDGLIRCMFENIRRHPGTSEDYSWAINFIKGYQFNYFLETGKLEAKK